ncbi:protein COFACTOR ASSEMBLY OF COMPLEX C SUBUNIT B CCB4, chloroplastic [Nymphaea colorata]|nr:protein COFACTOR ASSEMBLY OF COMPLEX C SUBUNIT B CCB4, chloroplastic [Nymphaea colorata]
MFSTLLKPSLARPLLPIPLLERPSLGRLRLVKSDSSRIFARLQGGYRGPVPKKDWIVEWVLSNGDAVRSLPIYVGGFSLVAVLLNRTASLVAPVIDASSSQSRTDILALALAVTNILTGLVWLSIRPKYVPQVIPQGVQCRKMLPDLPPSIEAEVLWLWKSLEDVTCCRSLVIVYKNTCVLQIGVAAESSAKEGDIVIVDAEKFVQCSIYESVKKSLKQIYLANLSLYPGRSEFPFLPPNTQALILQPIGEKGMMVIGGDMIRGFTGADQSWITLLGEKLDATFSKAWADSSIPVER